MREVGMRERLHQVDAYQQCDANWTHSPRESLRTFQDRRSRGELTSRKRSDLRGVDVRGREPRDENNPDAVQPAKECVIRIICLNTVVVVSFSLQVGRQQLKWKEAIAR